MELCFASFLLLLMLRAPFMCRMFFLILPFLESSLCLKYMFGTFLFELNISFSMKKKRKLKEGKTIEAEDTGNGYDK